MINEDQINLLKETVAGARTVLVMVGPMATLDDLAGASSIVVGLASQGKQVSLHAPVTPVVDTHGLVGVDTLQTELGNKQLQVSFPYRPEQVDKVSYHIDEEKQRFYLIVKPQSGYTPLDTKEVEMVYAGAEADLVWLIGVRTLEELEHLYELYPQLYSDAATAVMTRYAPQFGQMKLDTTGYTCISEAVAVLLPQLGIELTADMATNLLAGIEVETESFASPQVNAQTLEVGGQLLRAGARRVRRRHPQGSSGNSGSVTQTPKPVQSPRPEVRQLASDTQVNVRPQANQKSSLDLSQAMQKNNQNKKNQKSKPRPGDLDYEPSGFGPGGAN